MNFNWSWMHSWISHFVFQLSFRICCLWTISLEQWHYIFIVLRLQGSELIVRAPTKKPRVFKKNQRARPRLNHEHGVWKEQWLLVHFCVESGLSVIGSDGEMYIWRRSDESLLLAFVRTVKYEGGNVQVCGMISAAGPGLLIHLQGIVNAEIYK